MVPLRWSLIPKSFRLLTGLLLMFLGFYALNLWQFKRLKLGVYLPSVITFTAAPASVVLGEDSTYTWKVSAPTPRSASTTALYWGDSSTSSAFLASPKESPYTNYSPDYLNGPFALPEEFSVTLRPTVGKTIYLRAYARVDNQNLWSDEIKLQVKEN